MAFDSNLKGGSRPGSGKSLALAAWDPLEEVNSIVDSNSLEGVGSNFERASKLSKNWPLLFRFEFELY